jgi:hypothetical protein
MHKKEKRRRRKGNGIHLREKTIYGGKVEISGRRIEEAQTISTEPRLFSLEHGH